MTSLRTLGQRHQATWCQRVKKYGGTDTVEHPAPVEEDFALGLATERRERCPQTRRLCACCWTRTGMESAHGSTRHADGSISYTRDYVNGAD